MTLLAGASAPGGLDISGDTDELVAGEFGGWLRSINAAIRGEQSSDVPCGACTACCTSSQFVHIGPEETETLARIPATLRFPAPGFPRRHVLLGYDERGHCPMLSEGACSIYEHRPRTCRTYDCRVFAAADVTADADQPAITALSRRWRFSYGDPSDRVRHDAVRAAAMHLGDAHPPTGRAVLAVQLFEMFLEDGPAGPMIVEPAPDLLRLALHRFAASRSR